jgi:diguanylate cyclase (GGDEF)-like protein
VLHEDGIYSPPRTRFGKWLGEPGRDVPADISPVLLAGLFGTLTIFMGGVVNTMAISIVSAIRRPDPLFICWAAYEVVLAMVRLAVLMTARRNARAGRETPTDLYLFLALGWAGGVGFGAFIGMTCGDWVITVIACVSAGAMSGGIAFRNFYAPRLAAAMIMLSFAPCMIGAALSGVTVLWLLALQIPIYLYSMWTGARRLNDMFVRTLTAERENDRRASHDMLTGLSNRIGLERRLIELSATRNGPLTLFYLDLDGFKGVNDRHGHAAGDALLEMVAARLKRLAPADGIAARIGGDEFALLVQEKDRGATLGKAERVIAAIAAWPYDLGDGRSVSIGTSIGIARMPDHGDDLAALLAAADAALYEAKAKGRCRAVLAGGPASPRIRTTVLAETLAIAS